MSKFLVGLVLLSSTSVVFAQGHYMFPQNPAQTYSNPPLPNAGYYPTMPYAYPAYPLQLYPIAPGLLYPYGAYPNTMSGLGVSNPVAQVPSAPTYAYTSPYNPNQPAMPGPKPAPAPEVKKETKPWGDTRYIWPDFYTDQTSELWDNMINAPHELGYLPGGWRFPSFSSPDPVTVGDAVANQVPPIVEEVPNFMNFTN